jgi:hypothetical protein
MRFWLWLWLWLLAIVVTASTTSAADVAASDDPARALIALERKWVIALQRSDTKTLSALWAQTYVDTDEAGHRSDKAEVLRVLKSGALKLRKLQLSDMRAYVYGDAAVVTGTRWRLPGTTACRQNRVYRYIRSRRRHLESRCVAAHRISIISRHAALTRRY